MEYSFRRATPDDIDDLVRQTLDMAIETENRALDGAAIASGVHTTFLKPNLADYFVAVSGGDQTSSVITVASSTTTNASASKPPQVVGFIMTTREYKVRTGTTVQLLQTVYITPEHRRRGLFRRFYEHVKSEVLADPTCEGIWLYVEEANTSAILAYQRVGLRREERHMMRWSKCGF